MELIEKYQRELEIDTKVDEINLTDYSYKLPAIKHKWVARYINAKISLSKLEKQKREAKDKIVNKLSEASDLKISKIALSKSINNTEEYNLFSQKIDEKIEEYKMIILYLEKVENIFKNMTFDLKNIIDLNKLETT